MIEEEMATVVVEVGMEVKDNKLTTTYSLIVNMI